jgi:hypothetical protein
VFHRAPQDTTSPSEARHVMGGVALSSSSQLPCLVSTRLYTNRILTNQGSWLLPTRTPPTQDA